MLRCVDLVRTDVSEERLVTANVVATSPIRLTLMMEALSSYETPVLNNSHTA
jgi:hypothetical protein